jgi:hypothetical protein
MIAPRHLMFLGFLSLLTGCGSWPCVAPDEVIEKPARHCYYKLQVTEVSLDNYLVKAKMPSDLPGNKDEFTFRVRDLDKLEKNQIKAGGTYHFIRAGNSPYLELFPKEPTSPELKK